MPTTKHPNLCDLCPKKIRGLCCYYSIPINGYNIILTKHRCIYLNKKTRLCNKYKDRKKFFPECETGPEGVGKGALPKGCLYLKDKEHLEPLPKVRFKDIRKFLSQEEIQFYHKINSNKRSIEKNPEMTIKI